MEILCEVSFADHGSFQRNVIDRLERTELVIPFAIILSNPQEISLRSGVHPLNRQSGQDLRGIDRRRVKIDPGTAVRPQSFETISDIGRGESHQEFASARSLDSGTGFPTFFAALMRRSVIRSKQRALG